MPLFNRPVPRFSFGVPWFMYDIYNKQLITSRIIPGDIHDTKQIVLTEVPIPGLNYQPIIPAGGGNRRLSFMLPLIRRDALFGNVALLKQFDQLRNQAAGLRQIASRQFSSTPKVLFYWGTGSVPLVYWVAKADATHKQGWVNSAGLPQYSEIEMELILDENDKLYRAEEAFRRVSAILSSVATPVEIALGYTQNRRPY